MKKYYKSIFLSDIHIGSKYCKSDILVEFLKEYKSDNLFLIGDIIDLLRLKQKFNITKSQIQILHQFFKRIKNDCNIFYIIGNHDHDIREFLNYDIKIENLQLLNEYVYITKNNKKLLLIHGDILDLPIIRSLYIIGDLGYNLILEINHWFNKIRQLFKMPYWSLSQRIKHSVKNAIKYIEDYEENLLKYCIYKNYDGIISGHIHKSRLDIVNNKYLFNTGDWIESCSFILEDFDGNFILMHHKDGKFKEIKRIKI